MSRAASRAGGAGVALLLVALWATVFVWLAVHNAFPPMIPVALLLAVAVPVAYLADILRTAATGADDAPEPTDVSLGLGELFAPTVRLAAAIALLVAPPLAVRALGASTLTWGGLAVACALVAPAALITAAYGRPRPLIALRLIGRLTLPYLTLLLSLLAIAAAGAAMTLGVGALLRAAGLGELPLLPGWLVTATLLYGPFATAHALGRFLHRHRLDLGLD